MSPLIISSITVALIYLSDSWIIKSKRSIANYLSLFFLLAGVQYALRAYHAEASTFDKYLTEKSSIVLTVENNVKSNRDAKREFMIRCKEQIQYHQDEANKYFKEAEETCLLMPADDKKKAEWCFSSAISALYPGSPAQKVIAGIITLVAQYGLSVNAEWQRVDTLLHRTKYHYEMEQHYIISYNYIVGLLNAEKREEN